VRVITYLDKGSQVMVTTYMITLMICVFSLCLFLLRSKKSAIKTAFSIVIVVMIVWLFFAIRQRVSTTYSELLFNIRINLICINFIAPVWLIATLLYTKVLHEKNMFLLYIIVLLPLILSIPLFFPPSSKVFMLYLKEIAMDEKSKITYEVWGVFERITVISTILCVFVSFASLFRYLIKRPHIALIEKIILLCGIWLPILVNNIYKFEWFGKFPFDLTPLSFAFVLLIIVYLCFRRQFFNMTPYLTSNIFNEIKDGILIIDPDSTVIDYNKAFADEFSSFGFKNEIDVNELFDQIFIKPEDAKALIFASHENPHVEIESMNGNSRKLYEVTTKTVESKKRRKTLGAIVIIRDISELKRLTLVEERSRIARGIHDNMGNRLVAAINNLNLALIQPSIDTANPFVNSALVSSTSSLLMLRRIIEGLSPVDFNKSGIINLIGSIVNRTVASGTEVDFIHNGDFEAIPFDVKELIYNVCQEAIMNSLIHGRAERISIVLNNTGTVILLHINDDGIGCEEISKNNGLKNMEFMVLTVGGEISFESSKSGGFNIFIEIQVTDP